MSYLPLSVLAALLGGAAAAEGQGAVNALGMDRSSCGFDRVHSRPAIAIKGAKKAAYYPKIRHSPQSLARHLASPLFLPAAASYHEVLAVAQLDKADAACAEADAARPYKGFCHAAPRLSLLRFLPPPHPPIFFCAGTAPRFVGRAAGRNETQAARSVPTRRATAAWAK
jgi:hypothetical protein